MIAGLVQVSERPQPEITDPTHPCPARRPRPAPDDSQRWRHKFGEPRIERPLVITRVYSYHGGVPTKRAEVRSEQAYTMRAGTVVRWKMWAYHQNPMHHHFHCVYVQ